MATSSVLEPFLWGSGGRKLTPDQIAREREIAAVLMGAGVDTSPVGHWLQGAARLAQTVAGKIREGRANKAEREIGENSRRVMEALLSGLGGGVPASSSYPVGSAGAQPLDYASTRVAVAHGDVKPYLDALASIESAGSGDYSAIGPTHDELGRALGRYQIMEANLAPWSQEALGRTVTAEEFLASPQLQDAIAGHRFQQYLQQFGDPALAAQAWFAGPGGVGTNRQDALGTSVPEYAQRFMSALQPTQAQQPTGPRAPVQVAEASGIHPAIIEALSSPYVDGRTKQVAMALLQDQLGQISNQRAAQIAQQQRLMAAQAAGIDPRFIIDDDLWKQAVGAQFREQPSEVREYLFAREQGYPGTFADWQLEKRRAGATNVTVGGEGAPGLGKLSPDYGYVLDPATGKPIIDPETGLPRAAPIPGSPAARDLEKERMSLENKEEQRRTWNAIVDQEIGRALSLIEEAALPTTGLPGQLLSNLGGTAARDLRGLIDTIKANAGFDRLQAMRDASPTGGALGQVSERELAFLQSTIGNLEQSQSREQLEFNLKRIKKIYENLLSGKRAYDGLLSEKRENTPISEMTDEELEAIVNGR